VKKYVPWCVELLTVTFRAAAAEWAEALVPG